MLLPAKSHVRSFTSADIDQAILIAEEQKLSFWSADGFREHLKEESNFAVALTGINHIVIGFLVARLVPGDGTNSDAELLNLGIAETYKRQLGGTQLMEGFLEWCRKQDVERVWLEVRESNDAAQNFYIRFGFLQTGRRKNFYTESREDAFIMCRELVGSGS